MKGMVTVPIPEVEFFEYFVGQKISFNTIS